jgi:hypothetical protein
MRYVNVIRHSKQTRINTSIGHRNKAWNKDTYFQESEADMTPSGAFPPRRTVRLFAILIEAAQPNDDTSF